MEKLEILVASDMRFVLTAVKDGKVAAKFWYPIVLARDWSIYAAGTPEENDFRECVRAGVVRMTEGPRRVADAFLATYGKNGYSVYFGLEGLEGPGPIFN